MTYSDDIINQGTLCLGYRVIQQNWFARVKVLCNLSRKKLREVAAHFRADF